MSEVRKEPRPTILRFAQEVETSATAAAFGGPFELSCQEEWRRADYETLSTMLRDRVAMVEGWVLSERSFDCSHHLFDIGLIAAALADKIKEEVSDA